MFPEQILEQIVLNCNESIVICKDEKNLPIVFVNDAFLKMTGYTRDEVIGKHPGRLLQSRHTNPITKNKIREALDKKLPVRAVILNSKANGEQYWGDLDIFHHYCSSEDQSYFISIQRDVTDRKELEESLLEYKEFYDEAPIALIRTDLETGKFLMANKMAAKLLGFDNVPELLESGCSKDYYSEKDRAQLISTMRKLGEVKGYELQLSIQDEEIWVSADMHINCGGSCIEGSLTDITELVQIKRSQIEVANRLSETLLRLKTA